MIETSVKSVVWDLDGTLLKSFEGHVDIVTQLWPRYNLPVPSLETMAHNFYGRLEDSLRSLLPDTDEVQFRRVLNDFLVIDNEYMKDVNDHLHQDAVKLGLRLQHSGATQILLTNRVHGVDRGTASPRYIVRHSHLKDFIDVVICGDEVEHHKPDPRVFDDKGVVIKPGQTLVMGDQFVDAQLAKNLGTQAIIVNRNHHDVPHLDRLGDGWEKLVTIVKTLDDVTM